MIPNVSHTIPTGHKLEVRLLVDGKSGADMWFAYDTASYPAVLKLP